ncbi:helix-turn-helix domain-containing protein [Candidatus Symbiopectobacterium sp. NZEC135]|uniref:helix-turn-helix domain-containing protein n=1 Tax=Candidatus Symbiopectobacterium sp. NZEC135 TaxID=2820471 RepID=UPI002225C6B3|nr:AraC family transcriptional regulator [Candidatus Symbiopectobacterium sp. NZEC135]MCW2481699.1 helix-turn-helix transcriptional regulator [Candidatus Symbiopectobacterium sp. NZEC135]
MGEGRSSPTQRVIPRMVLREGNRRQLPDQFGQCWSQSDALADGLTLVTSSYQPLKPLVEEAETAHSQPVLVMTFGLNGESNYSEKRGASMTFRQQHVTIASFHHSLGERYYPERQKVDQLRLLVSESMLERYIGGAATERLFGDYRLRQHAYNRVTPVAQQHLHALQQAQGDMLSMHIHALNLLAAHRYLFEETREAARLHPQDVVAVERARDWMVAHLNETLSLGALALAVGLSEYKLKLAFHRHFNTTPGQMLLQLRMEEAHRLLEHGLQVAQVAWRVGYRHANNFSVAFWRYYGRYPKSI